MSSIIGSLELCRLNRIVYKIVFTLIKKFHNKVFKCYLSITPSVALLSYLFLCSVFKVQTTQEVWMVENNGIEPLTS